MSTSLLEPIEKIYFAIGEVAEMIKVSPSLLRFWETEFDLINPRKNKKGDRLYKKEDIQIIRTIYHLVKEKRFTLEGAREYLKKNKKNELKREELKDRLHAVKANLESIRNVVS